MQSCPTYMTALYLPYSSLKENYGYDHYFLLMFIVLLIYCQYERLYNNIVGACVILYHIVCCMQTHQSKVYLIVQKLNVQLSVFSPTTTSTRLDNFIKSLFFFIQFALLNAVLTLMQKLSASIDDLTCSQHGNYIEKV